MSDPVIVKPLGFPWDTFDPFLFCAHHRDVYPPGNKHLGPAPRLLRGRNIGHDFTLRDGWRMYHGTRIPGFPYHPHRGFETITLVREGVADHFDSLGGCGRIGAGDVQWMTAGRGIQHSEMFPLLNTAQNNPLEIFQIWLNLPRQHKFAAPVYRMHWAGTLPVWHYTDKQGRTAGIEVITGRLGEAVAPPAPVHSWAADPANGVVVAILDLAAGVRLSLSSPGEGVRRTLYFYRGKSLEVGGRQVGVNNLVSCTGTQELPLTNADEPAAILLLQGRPIEEPVVQYGPFVMNSEEEIRQAMADYRETAFGGWPWPEPDPVHPRDQGRFASWSGGRTEYPPTAGKVPTP